MRTDRNPMVETYNAIRRLRASGEIVEMVPIIRPTPVRGQTYESRDHGTCIVEQNIGGIAVVLKKAA